MNAPTIIIALIVLAFFVLAIRRVVKKGSCGDCSACAGGNPDSSCSSTGTCSGNCASHIKNPK